jgi:hypothetical protein
MQAEDQGTGAAGPHALERLIRLEVGEAVVHDRIAVFPLFDRGSPSGNGGAGAVGVRYRTLQQAISAGEVEVTEQPRASVPELVLRNKGQTMVLVLDGEEIVGGRQNRIVNASFLVAEDATIVLPVSCVEQGRWHDISATFTSGESSPLRLKRLKHEQVTKSLRASGRHATDQEAVWASVAESAALARSYSPSGAMHDIYRARDQDLDAYQRALGYVAGACGLLVAMNGRMAGGDVFDQSGTAEALWPKLVRSYVLDALAGTPGSPAAHEDAIQLLAATQGARYEAFPSLALGSDVRFEAEGVIGGGLVYQDTPVHISLFQTGDAGDGEQTGSGGIAQVAQRREWRRQRPRSSAQEERSESPAQHHAPNEAEDQ